MTAWKIYSITEFQRFAPAWNRVNTSGRSVPFLHSSFIAYALREFGSGEEKLAVRGGAGAEDALAVMRSTGKGAWESFQPAQLPLGAWVMASTLDYSDALDGLFAALPGAVMLIGVTQQDPHVHERPPDAGALQTLDYIQTAWVDIDGDFDTYWMARGKNLRQNMRKQRTKVEAEASKPLLDVITEPDRVAAAIEDYGRLESGGWKSEEGTAVHPDNAQGRFYRSMLEDYCKRGCGRIYRYRIGERVVAMDLCVENDDTQVILKTAYDESNKQLSPATLMRQESFAQIFSEGRIRRIEFYGRLMEWHTRWTDKARTLFHVNAYRSGALRWLRDQLA
jgi:CelD/BcsL family acetyltransferase involved in cellulose biosynthesis